MSDPFDGRPFPRAVLVGAAVLITFVISVAAFVQMTGVGKTTLELADPVLTRELRFDALGGGTTEVFDIGEGAVIAVLESGEDGFILGVLRAMGRQRTVQDVPKDAPYLLSLREDGRLIFEDPQTGDQIDLRAFGPDNAASFADLLRAGAAPEPVASPLESQPRAQ